MLSHNYYYFVASLPYLNYGDKPPMSPEEFIEKSKGYLSSGDAALLCYCHFDPKLATETIKSTGSAFLDFLMQRERTLNLTLARLRAAKLNRPSPGELTHDMPRAEAMANATFEMSNPLEAELSLDRARWGVLDELVGINLFGVNNIYAYYLKLQLLERKQRFNIPKGTAEYRKIYETILNEYNSNV